MTLKVAIDVDGVLRDIVQFACDDYNQKYGENKTPKDVTAWNFRKCFPKEHDMPEHLFHGQPHRVFVLSKAYDGAAEFMKRLYESYDVWIITHQERGNEHYTLQWLINNDIHYHHVCFTRQKETVQCDILLDDANHNLEVFKGAAICMDRPWNKEWNGERVSTYDEFVQRVEKEVARKHRLFH